MPKGLIYGQNWPITLVLNIVFQMFEILKTETDRKTFEIHWSIMITVYDYVIIQCYHPPLLLHALSKFIRKMWLCQSDFETWDKIFLKCFRWRKEEVKKILEIFQEKKGIQMIVLNVLWICGEFVGISVTSWGPN